MFTPLRQRGFLLFWLSEIFNGIADILYRVGIIVTIYEITGSTFQAAFTTVATTLPIFVIGPFAGAVIDRFPRQRVLFAMNIFRILLIGSLLVLARLQEFSLVAFYVIVALLAVATAFYEPGRLAIIPSLVPRKTVIAANSLLLSTIQLTAAIGFLLGGILVLVLSFELFVALNLLSFAIATVLVGIVKVNPPLQEDKIDEEQAPDKFLTTITNGFSYVRQHQLARKLVIMETIEHIPHGLWTSAMMLALVTNAFGGDAQDWGVQVSIYFTGMIIGSILVGVFAHRFEAVAVRVIVVNAFVSAVLTIIFAISPNLTIAAFIALLFGPPAAARDVAQDSLLQTNVDDAMLGRVFATRSMLRNLFFMMSGLGFAYLADRINIRYIYIAGGIMYGFTALYALTMLRLPQAKLQNA